MRIMIAPFAILAQEQAAVAAGKAGMSIMIAPFAILAVLMVVGLLVAGVIALLVWRRGRAVLWALVVLALLGVPAMFLFYRAADVPVMMRTNTENDKMLEELQRIEQQEKPTAEPDVELSSQMPAGEDMSAFLADVYPSAELAVRAAARDAARSVSSVGASLPGPPPIRVSGGVPAALLSQAVEGLRQSGSQVGAIEMEPTGPEAPATQPAAASKILCDVRVDAGQHGTASVTLRGPQIQVSRTAGFRATPWAADFGRFGNGGGGRQILAQSRRPCTSLEEAQRAALDDAAGQLLPTFERAVVVSLAQQGQTRPTWLQGPQLRQTLTREIERDGAMILDRFPQRYPRPYGEIWRQSLLVNASPAVVDDAARRFCAIAVSLRGAQASTWGRLAMSIGGLGVLILAVYLILNAATRGYYSLVLRLAAIALVVAGTIIVFWVS